MAKEFCSRETASAIQVLASRINQKHWFFEAYCQRSMDGYIVVVTARRTSELIGMIGYRSQEYWRLAPGPRKKGKSPWTRIGSADDVMMLLKSLS